MNLRWDKLSANKSFEICDTITSLCLAINGKIIFSKLNCNIGVNAVLLKLTINLAALSFWQEIFRLLMLPILRCQYIQCCRRGYRFGLPIFFRQSRVSVLPRYYANLLLIFVGPYPKDYGKMRRNFDERHKIATKFWKIPFYSCYI